MDISFVIPCRSNAKYFKWAYDSIRKNQGNHNVFICAANDASEDHTVFLFHEIAAKDPQFSYVTNPGPERVGHTILYDRIVNELVKTDVAIIYHADMYLCPGALDEIEKHMYEVNTVPITQMLNGDGEHLYFERGTYKTPKYGTIVSLTRIEPPLHPPGPEKILSNWDIEPEFFKEDEFLYWFEGMRKQFKQESPNLDFGYKTTNGIFAPWAFFVNDFKEVGGHDPLYRPQSKEDSDIFNKFALNGIKFIQTWGGFVYHMTCRGSRFNPLLTSVGQNSNEWMAHNIKSTKNFIRKWGTFVSHDDLMKPIIKPKYNIGLILENATFESISALEPWFSGIYCTNMFNSPGHVEQYIQKEQPNTLYDLSEKVVFILPEMIDTYLNLNKSHDVWVHCLNDNDDTRGLLTLIQEILHNDKDNIQPGMFQLHPMINVKVNQLVDTVRDNLLEKNNVEGVRKSL